MTSVVRRTGVPLGAATASTVFLRAADIARRRSASRRVAEPGSSRRGLLGGVGAARSLAGRGAALVAAARLAAPARAASAARAPPAAGPRRGRRDGRVAARERGALAGRALRRDRAALRSRRCSSPPVTIAAQMVAIAPGGIGTYEAAATRARSSALGAEPGAALAAAVTAHALKTAYSLVAGARRGRPSRAGPARPPAPAPRRSSRSRPAARSAAAGPVVLFLPAHDEEARGRRASSRACPRASAGRPVALPRRRRRLDRRDRAPRPQAPGADVVSLGRNRGLGRRRPRRACADAVARGAAAVAFCDADGEYAPEELERARRADPRRRGRLRRRLALRRRRAARCARTAARQPSCSRAVLRFVARGADHRRPERLPRALAARRRRRRDHPRLQLRAGADARPARQGLPLRRGADQLPLPQRAAARSSGSAATCAASCRRSTAS